MVYRPVWPLLAQGYVCEAEDTARGYPFYLTSVGRYTCGEGFITRRSGRKDYQLLHTVAGEGYFLLDGERLRLQPGSYVLIDCDKLHEYGTAVAEWTYEHMHFSGEGMRPFREKLLNTPCVVYPRDDILLNMYLKCFAVGRPQSGDVGCAHACTAISLCLSAILADRLALSDGGEQARGDVSVIEPALHYIHLHYTESICLDDLLNVTYLSRYYFCRKFKSFTGYSPYHYITKLRMEKARELLLTTVKPVAHIAKLTGYSDSGQFTRQFTKYAGLTPEAIRAQGQPGFNERVVNGIPRRQ